MLDLSKKLVENNDMPRQPISRTSKPADRQPRRETQTVDR
nr:MAG TPA: hypothetical protein [Caudoviricetes sp.]